MYFILYLSNYQTVIIKCTYCQYNFQCLAIYIIHNYIEYIYLFITDQAMAQSIDNLYVLKNIIKQYMYAKNQYLVRTMEI